jgi:hypothetical protein
MAIILWKMKKKRQSSLRRFSQIWLHPRYEVQTDNNQTFFPFACTLITKYRNLAILFFSLLAIKTSKINSLSKNFLLGEISPRQ